jgi:hypothetical protein
MRCPPIRFRRPGSGCPAVRCPVTWGRRPEGPALGRPLSSRPVSAPSVRTRPSPPMLRRWRWGPGRGGGATVTTGTGGGPGGCRAVDGSIDGSRGRDAGDAAEVGLVSGRRAERPSRAAALWAREQAAARGWPHAAWLPSSGWVRDYGAWASPSLTAGWAAPEGHWTCRRGWACGPSAAQARNEHDRLAAGSALSCDDGWWACQDLNLGPHPYQAHSRDAFQQQER